MGDDVLVFPPFVDDAMAEATARPCSGECGKAWSDAGGWIHFEPLPHWYCTECDERVHGKFDDALPEGESR